MRLGARLVYTVRLIFGFSLLFLLARDAQAQQNLFNVPSSEITAKDLPFFQQQFNVTKDFTSSTTFAYGLGHDFEVGFNIFNVPLSRPRGLRQMGAPALDPIYLFTAQKRFEVGKYFDWSIGTQLGGKLDRAGKGNLRTYTYLNGIFSLPNDRARAVVGPYFAQVESDGSRQLGFQAGLDVPIVRDKIHFIGDFISGHAAYSYGTAGLVFFTPKGLQISAGALLPAPASGNDYGVVFELTYYRPRSPSPGSEE